MPLENEHACRIADPEQFDRIRRDNSRDPNVLLGFRGDDGGTVQSYRYPTSRWGEQRARSHCGEQGGTFEPAASDADVGQVLAAGRRLGVEHLEQYVGTWAMEGRAFAQMRRQLASMDLAAHVEAQRARQAHGDGDAVGGPMQRTSDGIAVLHASGMLTKYGSSMSAAPSMIEMRRSLRAAAEDPEIRGIVLSLDSPGGTAAGSGDLAAEVRAAAQRKPVYAYAEDMAASAAYRIPSQAARLFANEDAMVGSIGTFAVIHDESQAAERAGVKVHVVRSGAFKGIGEEGAPVSEDELAQVQKDVEQINAMFLRDLRRGRGFSDEKLAKIADGRVFATEEALELGLIDGVRTFEGVLEEIRQAAGGRAGARSRGRRRAAQAREASMSYRADDTKQGENLAAELNGLIDEQATEDRPRSQIVEEMAEAAGIAASTVNGILNAQINCPPLRRLEGFAEVLGTRVSRLRNAAEDDGCRYDDDGNPTQCAPGFEIRDHQAVRKKEQTMSTPTPKQLKDAFPASTAEEREHVIEQQMSFEDACSYLGNAISARLENRESELEESKSQSGRTQRPSRQAVGEAAQADAGEDTGGDSADAEDDPVGRFHQLVEQKKQQGLDRAKAVEQVARKNPELHRQYVIATQEDKSARRAAEAAFAED